MADLVLPARFLETYQPPAICARTGRPSRRLHRATLMKAPVWTYLLIVGGLLPFVFVYYAVATKSQFHLPISGQAAIRRRLAVAASSLALLPALVTIGVLVAAPGVVSAVVALAGIGAFVGPMVWHRRLWVRARLVDEHTVELRRLHPEFAAAVQQQFELRTRPPVAATPAGWYADPSGTYDYRYWDGAAWTTNVSTAGVAAISA